MRVAMPDKDIPPEFRAALGTINIRWAHVENIINEWFSHMMIANAGYMYLVTQNVSGSTILDWLRTLIEMRIEDALDCEKLIKVTKWADDLRLARNSLVHGLWRAEPDNAVTVQTVKLERAHIVKSEHITLPDLEEIADHIADLYAELTMIGKKIGFLKPAVQA